MTKAARMVFECQAHSRDAVANQRPPVPKYARVFGRGENSRGATLVTMMQTTDFWERDDLARGRQVYRTGLRAVLVKR